MILCFSYQPMVRASNKRRCAARLRRIRIRCRWNENSHLRRDGGVRQIFKRALRASSNLFDDLAQFLLTHFASHFRQQNGSGRSFARNHRYPAIHHARAWATVLRSSAIKFSCLLVSPTSQTIPNTTSRNISTTCTS